MKTPQTHVWCRDHAHESHHAILNGAAMCGTARLDRWSSWQLVKADEMDRSRQCTRCLGAVARAERRAERAAALMERFKRWKGLESLQTASNQGSGAGR